jgi:hypothetical protein
MIVTRQIFCCGCQDSVEARLTNGSEIYPHRKDLWGQPFWKCDACRNYVGTHHKTNKPTQPLGNIPTREIRIARQRVHAALDPLWKSGHYSRRAIYGHLTKKLGYQYHTAEIRTVDEADVVVHLLNELRVPA